MKNLNVYILESLNSYYQKMKKLFSPYNIELSNHGEENKQYKSFWSSYTYNDSITFFVITSKQDELFSISQSQVDDNYSNHFQIYDFIDGKWQIDNDISRFDISKSNPQTPIKDMPTAFSKENFEVLLKYMEDFDKKFSKSSENTNNKEKDKKRVKKVTPKINSLIKQHENGTQSSYNNFINYILDDDDLTKGEKNKIKKFLKPYQSNNFISLSEEMDMDDFDKLYDLIIFDGWYAEIDSSVVDSLEVGEESIITIHKYGDYTIIYTTIDIDRPDLYLVK